jgi:methionyl aminopeptidase
MTEYIHVGPEDRAEPRSHVIKLHGDEGFEGMRRAGRLAAEILDTLVSHVVPGVTTGELDAIVRRMTLEAGGVPATLGYRGYTKSCCTSINHVVCHGDPGRQGAQGRRYRQYRRDADPWMDGTATPAPCISSGTCH